MRDAGQLAVYSTGLLWLGYLIVTDAAPRFNPRVYRARDGQTLKGGLYPFIVI